MTESAEAIFPMDMLKVTPPEGTIISKLDYDREKQVSINQFGLATMAYGKIRTFDDKPRKSEEYADGTWLNFQPGNIKAHVVRRNLTGIEINQIGDLSVRMDNIYMVLGFLPQGIKQTTDLISKLRLLAYAQSEIQSTVQETDAQTEQEVADLGVMRQRMQEQQPVMKTKLDSIVLELNDLGVTLVENSTGSTRDQSFPVKLQADQIRAKQAQPAK